MNEPEVRNVLGAGDEPYTMDFGGRLREAFMERWLTPEEREAQKRAFERWWALWSRFPWWTPLRLRIAVCWPLERKLGRFVKLAEERGGPAPSADADLVFKTRTDFGSC